MSIVGTTAPIINQVDTSVSGKAISPSISPSNPSEAVLGSAGKREDLVSPHLAKLAKMERLLRKQIEEAKAKESSWKAKEQEYAEKYIPKSQVTERFRSDTLGAMKDFGLSYDQITQAQLQAPSPEAQMIHEIKAEMAALKQAYEKTQTTFQERDQQSRVQAENQIRNEVKVLIEKDADQFEMLKNSDSAEEVVKKILETVDQTGILPNYQDVAKEIEDQLIDGIIEMTKLKKVQERLAAINKPAELPTEESIVSRETTETPSQAKSWTPSKGRFSIKEVKDEDVILTRSAASSLNKTLTNAAAASPSKPLTTYERAILAARGELK